MHRNDTMVGFPPPLCFRLLLQVCASVFVIIYLYRYIYKGPDRNSAAIVSSAGGVAASDGDNTVRRWKKLRVLTASEASWRIFEWRMSYRSHPTTAICIHRPNPSFQEQLEASRDQCDEYQVAQDPIMGILDSAAVGGRANRTTPAPTLFQRYLARPLDAIFDDMTIEEYYLQYNRVKWSQLSPAKRARREVRGCTISHLQSKMCL